MNIGENIKNFRTFRGFSQQEIADKLDKTKSVISNWERGANSPDVEACEKLCKILNVTPNELFGWDKNEEYEKQMKRLAEYHGRIFELEKEKEKIDKEIQSLNSLLLYDHMKKE
jgi:transcriptional regulator with XRE-family HTH domain